MKKTLTISVIAGYFLLIGALGIAASPGRAADTSSKEVVRREIVRNITCPAFIIENNLVNDVRAIVSVDENGKVNITDINSANPKLLEYVAAQLENMTIKNVTSPEKFILIIHFKAA